MILDTLANADRYAALHARFEAGFEFLRRTGLETMPPGRYPIHGDDLFAIVSKTNGRTREEAKLECHRKYIDIQFIIHGTDTMGWKPTAACHHPQSEYAPEKDIQFFADLPDSWVATPAGSFCLFFPDDAHAPLVSDGEIHKVVLKIAVE
jgi:YhcH/YjgK/YiaL family protein